MKSEEVKLRLRPKHKGSFTLKPRIMYVDENSNVKLHQPEPLTITVKELGISGWIRSIDRRKVTGEPVLRNHLCVRDSVRWHALRFAF